MQHERNMKGNECEMKGNECNMKGNERNARHLLAFDQGYFTPTESWTIQMSSTQSSTPEKTIRARRSDNMISRYCKRHFFLIPHLLFILLQSRWFGKPGNTMAMVCGLFNFGFPFYPVSTDWILLHVASPLRSADWCDFAVLVLAKKASKHSTGRDCRDSGARHARCRLTESWGFIKAVQK